MDTQNPNEIKISNEIRSKILIDALQIGRAHV